MNYRAEVVKGVRIGLCAIAILSVALGLNVWRLALGHGSWLTGVAIGAQLSALISCSYATWRLRRLLQ